MKLCTQCVNVGATFYRLFSEWYQRETIMFVHSCVLVFLLPYLVASSHLFGYGKVSTRGKIGSRNWTTFFALADPGSEFSSCCLQDTYVIYRPVLRNPKFAQTFGHLMRFAVRHNFHRKDVIHVETADAHSLKPFNFIINFIRKVTVSYIRVPE